MPTLETRVDSLESILGQFIVHTDVALRRLENEMSEFKDEMSEFKDEMSEFKDEMRTFKDEMSEFKDEMRTFKDEVNKDRKRINRQLGDIANKIGTLVEDIVAPNIRAIAKEYFNCSDIEDFMVRRKKIHTRDREKRREFDVIAVCGNKVILNETKSTPRIGYIDDFKELLGEVYGYFPEYIGKEVIPIFSSLYIDEDVLRYLSRKGIYGMGMKDDTMDLLNYDEVSGKVKVHR